MYAQIDCNIFTVALRYGIEDCYGFKVTRTELALNTELASFLFEEKACLFIYACGNTSRYMGTVKRFLLVKIRFV